MTDLASRAQALLDMHHSPATLVLPTVWDVWSARTVVDAGFGALTIGSHPVADSRGQRDNEGMTIDDALDSVRRITAAVDVPVSADMESGYALAPAELVDRVLEAGVAGINVEDTVHSEGRVRSPAEHAEYIGAIRAAADSAGVALVINARTDAFIGAVESYADPLAEAIARLKLCEEAGARCVYPVKAPSREAIESLLSELSGPVNVLANPVDGSAAGSLADLQALGVHRVSMGPLLQKSLAPRLADLVGPWLG
ncbi:MAG: isocitrate lyase/phosphoenolpyruvate mutase family protein [Microthrixaceae bacterium]|nr:isocitrate lyase/phosphoenolpyruvate mutase family protein [Microthrixaceae bacterium]HPB45434.1 isocitrate lyase/phosphoenolpyruvate mutase family protein [Microthrixaceae bacterium]